MKDFTDNRDRYEDDELTYKVTPAATVSLLVVFVCYFHFLEFKQSSLLVAQKQLMESLRKKLGVLREAQRGLQDDIRANAQLGEEVGRRLVHLFIHLFVTHWVSLVPFYSDLRK